LLSYATPQPIPRASGEVLADIGWRTAGAVILAAQGLRLVAMLASARSPRVGELGPGPLDYAFGCLASLIAIVVAISLWACERWARWAMLSIALLATVYYIYIGQTPKPPGGSLIWYFIAAATMTYWALLLERPTNRLKLTIGIALAIVTQIGMFVLTTARH